MTNKLLYRLAILAGIASMPLMAEGPLSYYVQGGLINSQGDMRTLSKNPIGYGGEVGMQYNPADLGIGLIGHVGFLVSPMKTKSADANNYTVKAGHFGFGLAYPLGKLPMTLEASLMMHSFDVANGYMAGGGTLPDTSWKLGLRLMARYSITKQWGAGLGYTASEWVAGKNPSYMTVCAVYKF